MFALPNNESAPSGLKSPVAYSHTNQYVELKRLVKQQGLLEKQSIYYTFKIVLTLCLLALGLVPIVVVKNFWLLIPDALYMAFVSTQIAFIGHDAAHQQIAQTSRTNYIIGLMDSLLVGVSYSWWANKHNRHHSHPNQESLDPDIEIPFISFTEEQARSRQKLARFVTKYQAYFYIPMYTLLPFSMRLVSVQFLLRKKGVGLLIEGSLILIGIFLYLSLLISQLGMWKALLFLAIHQAFFGLFLGSVFVSNHTGMPILEKEEQMDFLSRQVLTARNIKSNPLIDFWYGGLNYQIEHHLFPKMPRNKLKEARLIVKSFCQKYSIAYCETNFSETYRDIHQYFQRIAAEVR
jgi:fatty acid desaturase